MSQAESEQDAVRDSEKELVLRLTRRRDDAVEKNRLRDALRFLARKFGWDIKGEDMEQ